MAWVGLTEQTLFKKYIYNIQINWSAFHIAVYMSFKKFVCVTACTVCVDHIWTILPFLPMQLYFV